MNKKILPKGLLFAAKKRTINPFLFKILRLSWPERIEENAKFPLDFLEWE